MAVTRKRLPQLWQPLPCGHRQTVRLSAFPNYIAPGARASWSATVLAGTRHASGRWPHVAAAAVMDFAFTALSPHASCDTRRKPQTPGTAEEHKRQGTPRQLCPRHELRSYRSGMRVPQAHRRHRRDRRRPAVGDNHVFHMVVSSMHRGLSRGSRPNLAIASGIHVDVLRWMEVRGPRRL